MFKTIQVCRAIAAILVVFFHASNTLAKEKYFGAHAEVLREVCSFGGQAGVCFFFVLSGFIITHVHWKDFGRPSKLTQYFRKRACRIFPTYWILFCVVYVLLLVTASSPEYMPKNATSLVKSLLLLPQDPAVVGGNGAPVVVVAWTLQYEVLFYAAFALGIVRLWLYFGAWLVFLIGLTAQAILGWHTFPASFFTNPLILLFGMGALVAALFRRGIRVPSASVVAAGAAAGFFIVGAMSVNAVGHVGLFALAYGVFSAILVLALTCYESKKPDLPLDRLMVYGDSSYVLYLIHFPLLSLLCKVCAHAMPKNFIGAALSFAVMCPICVVCAVVFHKLIEKPLLARLMPKPSKRPHVDTGPLSEAANLALERP